MTRIGLLGYPNSGKTTLFNAVTGLEAPTAPHPYTTVEPNLGVVRIVDRRLNLVAGLEKSRKTTHATLDIHDLPAVRPGSVRGLGPRREPDLLLMVLRGHEEEWVPEGSHGTDPVAQAEELLIELAVADFEVFDRRRERILKEASADPALRPAAAAITRAADRLADGIPLRVTPWSGAELRAFRDLAPLSLVPCVWVINLSEDDLDRDTSVDRLRKVVPGTDPVVALSALLEEEVIRLDPSERKELYEGLGLGEGAAAVVARAAYDALGLLTFYTISPRECRAWTVPTGTTARAAAGKVHSDMERGFIRAEVAAIDHVIGRGGWDSARGATGVVRVEGQEYELRDGDVMLVRFSV
ncbi:MAG: DUF933 domain-containing protein [bacterium]|nr:DUF933 domain-containing protein [bacterium]MDE0289890.1 DUF933 domain-containing protein [bacterium]MDE0436840.1 DUF933 domain-containing protein [bacterium]